MKWEKWNKGEAFSITMPTREGGKDDRCPSTTYIVLKKSSTCLPNYAHFIKKLHRSEPRVRSNAGNPIRCRTLWWSAVLKIFQYAFSLTMNLSAKFEQHHLLDIDFNQKCKRMVLHLMRYCSDYIWMLLCYQQWTCVHNLKKKKKKSKINCRFWHRQKKKLNKSM